MIMRICSASNVPIDLTVCRLCDQNNYARFFVTLHNVINLVGFVVVASVR